jgi:gamma-glutamylcyclotransferase (GGCT)/AIG2-like uncharacterized protein YtfP
VTSEGWQRGDWIGSLERVLDHINAANDRSAGDRVARFRRAAGAVAPVLTEADEALLDFPSTRLAVYGTLAPGQPNHYVIAGLGGRWAEGSVDGVVRTVAGYPAFTWETGAGPVRVQVLESRRLPRHWPRIDAFEGPLYRCILVPVPTAEGVRVAFIYDARSRPRAGPSKALTKGPGCGSFGASLGA